MKRLLSIAAFFILGITAFISCKKGDTGPMGNANVIYSEWFTASPWTKDTIFSVWGFRYNKAAPEITKQMLDSAAILTFGKMLGYNSLAWPTGAVGQLPISLTYQQGTVMTDTWSAQASEGSLRIRFVNDKNYYPSIAATHQFRYIIIPGGTKPGARRAQQSYEEICKQYNIPE
jgi:hypothetical protein